MARPPPAGAAAGGAAAPPQPQQQQANAAGSAQEVGDALLALAGPAHPLTRAIRDDDLEFIVRQFARRDIDVNGLTTLDANGVTLLHAAAMFDRPAMIDFLVSRGANPNALDAKGKTPLMTAVWHRVSGKTIDALLSAGADVDARTPKGYTVFHIALRSASSSMISKIRRANPDVNTCSLEGITPLHDAAALPAALAQPLVDALLRCRQPCARGHVHIPARKTDAAEAGAMRAMLWDSCGTQLPLTPEALELSPLRPPRDADLFTRPTLTTRRKKKKNGSGARVGLGSPVHVEAHADPAAWPVPPPPSGPPPAGAIDGSAGDDLHAALFLRTPPQQPSAPPSAATATQPPAAVVSARDDASDDAEDDELAAPGGDVDVLCGRCKRRFGTCHCKLSEAPCWAPGRWGNTFADAVSPSNETALDVAARQSGGADVSTMLLVSRAYAMLESLVA